MRDSFHWERDTENFHVYVSDRRLAEGHAVIYLPKVLGTSQLPKQMDCIVTKREDGIQCCELDNDFDGNCARHSAPGVLRPGRRPEFRGGFTSRMRTVYDPPLNAGLAIHTALEHDLRLKELQRRMERTEHRVNILFKAVAIIIRSFKWPSTRTRKS